MTVRAELLGRETWLHAGIWDLNNHPVEVI